MRESSVNGHSPADPDGPANPTRPLVEVLDIRRLDTTGTRVLYFVVEAPVIGASSHTHVLPLQGWVLGAAEPVRELYVVEQRCDVRKFPPNMERPDVLAAYPHAPAQTCGFLTQIAYLGANRALTYTLYAGFADGAVIPLCEIDVRVGPLGSSTAEDPEKLRPLMLTTTGRTGSTYLMGVLSRHPQIVAYNPFEYDVRAARYWVDVFTSLAQPGSYMQSVVPSDRARPHWWLGLGELPPDAYLPGRAVMDYLESNAIDALADLCRDRIDAFYARIHREQQKDAARYFVEKCAPDRNAAVLRSLYPQRREIILVRDLRDVICSILALNRKRGYEGFGRENVRCDEEYTAYLRPSALQLLEAMTTETPDRGAYLLRYEDLVRHPRESLRKAFEFLDLDRSDAVLEEMLAPVPTAVVASQRTSADFDASIGRWRTEFTDSMRAAFLEHLEDISLQLGYAPTEPPAGPRSDAANVP